MRAFTLIELLVVISIMAIVSGAFFGARGAAEKKMALSRSAFRVAQDLREFQAKAMGAVQDYTCASGNVCGFGLHFDTSTADQYRPFVDCASDCANTNHARDGSDTDLTIKHLEQGVKISALAPVAPLDIVFVAPDPLVYINGAEWGAEATITLRFKTGDTKNVTINSACRIEH